MNADDAIGDGKDRDRAAGLSVAIVGNAIERLEDVDELRLRNALPVISDEKTNERERDGAGQPLLDGISRSGRRLHFE